MAKSPLIAPGMMCITISSFRLPSDKVQRESVSVKSHKIMEEQKIKKTTESKKHEKMYLVEDNQQLGITTH